MKIIKFSIICFVAVSLLQCKSSGKPEGFDYGSVEDNMYSNEFFAMTMETPEGWAVQSSEAMEQMSEAGRDMIVGDDAVKKAQLKISEINTANLFSAFQQEVGTPTDGFNANLILVAENLRLAPGVKSGADYLKLTKKLLEQAPIGYNFPSEITSTTLGGKSFDYMDATLNSQGMQIKQRYYSTILNGFSFCAIISYGNEEQKEILLSSLETMNFE